MTTTKHPGGRPSIYTDELAREICDTIATSQKSLLTLCKERDHWPDSSTVREWARNRPEFSALYAKAKDDQTEMFVEEILEIADDRSKDTIARVNEDGSVTEICNKEWIARARLRVDTRKWLASKYKAKKYGDRLVLSDDKSKEDEKQIDEVRKLVQKCSQD